MKIPPRQLFSLFKQSFVSMQKDNASVWCAALAYYTVFSLGPLLLILVSILGLIFSKRTVEYQLFSQLEDLMGSRGTLLITTVLHNTNHPTTSIIAMIIGTATLIWGATGVFVQLQNMLNAIWGVKAKPHKGLLVFVRQRVLNFSLLGAIAFLLLVSLIASTVIAGIGPYLGQLFPFSPVILEVINFIVSLALITVLFAITLKLLPDVTTKWSNIWVGALLTALLFTVGKTLLGIYIGKSGIASTYGFAASLVILLLWVFYASQILFFGTEFTKNLTLWRQNEIIPSSYAELVHGKQKTSHDTPKERVRKQARAFTNDVINKIAQKRKQRQ